MSAPDKSSSPKDGVSPSQAIIEAVADSEGVSVTDIEPPTYEPLYAAINPEALDRLVSTASGDPLSLRIVFEYEGYEVTVYGTGQVQLTDPEP